MFSKENNFADPGNTFKPLAVWTAFKYKFILWIFYPRFYLFWLVVLLDPDLFFFWKHPASGSARTGTFAHLRITIPVPHQCWYHKHAFIAPRFTQEYCAIALHCLPCSFGSWRPYCAVTDLAQQLLTRQLLLSHLKVSKWYTLFSFSFIF
jgi:hypothetical protein